MCGRYASTRKRAELLEEFDVERDACSEDLEADYNVAPTKPVHAVVTRRARTAPGGTSAPPPHRELRVVRWGLVPSWAKDAAIGNRLINARIETAHEKPAFRRAFAKRRCLLPADGYYEWYTDGAAAPASTARPSTGRAGRKAPKQPFFIHRRDGDVLAMAGLYELWRDPSRDDDDPDAWRWTCTVLTTRAEDEIGRIHERMPLLVRPEQWETWLDPDAADAAALGDLLVPASPGRTGSRLAAYPVSTAVNKVANNGPALLEPLPPEGLSGDHAHLGAPLEP